MQDVSSCPHCGTNYTEPYGGQIDAGEVRYHCFACGSDFTVPITVRMMGEQSQAVARRDWFTRALVRVREDMGSQSIDPPGVRRFRAGEEVVMIQWGRQGSPVTRDSWWDSTDIDGAHIIDASKVEVIAILDEVLPE